MAEEIGVVVVGAGQAGLATSHELTAAGIEHVILERGRIGQTWRDRWDSFCLVTPNWTVRLPGGSYDGADPDGYMPRDEIVAHLEKYATSFQAPLRERVRVTELMPAPGGGIRLETAEGDLRARAVILSTGAYQRPYRPPTSGALPSELLQIDAESYSNPEALPPGPVLIIGSGQTGCQLAEELHRSGREVHLACGRTPWVYRRFEGKDSVTWLTESSFYELPVAELPSPMARLTGNPQTSGHDGGHDLHFRVLQQMGVGLYGHYLGAGDRKAYFADDLAECVAFGDARYDDVRAAIAKSCAARGIEPPEMPDPPPFVAEAGTSLHLAGFGAVIFTCGFRPDYRSWVAVPEAFDNLGFPCHREGASTVVEGLYFVGVHFLRKRKSALLSGVGEDAEVVVRQVAAQIKGPVRR